MPFHGKQQVPSYWWDYIYTERVAEIFGIEDYYAVSDDPLAIQVQSDREDLPVVAILIIKDGDAENQISIAEKLIKDLNEGRVTI